MKNSEATHAKYLAKNPAIIELPAWPPSSAMGLKVVYRSTLTGIHKHYLFEFEIDMSEAFLTSVAACGRDSRDVAIASDVSDVDTLIVVSPNKENFEESSGWHISSHRTSMILSTKFTAEAPSAYLSQSCNPRATTNSSPLCIKGLVFGSDACHSLRGQYTHCR